jgi:hypothetical protein
VVAAAIHYASRMLDYYLTFWQLAHVYRQSLLDTALAMFGCYIPQYVNNRPGGSIFVGITVVITAISRNLLKYNKFFYLKLNLLFVGITVVSTAISRNLLKYNKFSYLKLNLLTVYLYGLI